MSIPLMDPAGLAAVPVRRIVALEPATGVLQLRPSASDPTYCRAALGPQTQVVDAGGRPLNPARLQVGDVVQLGGTLTAQRVLLAAWLRRCGPTPTAPA